MSFLERMPLSWQCFLHFSENMTFVETAITHAQNKKLNK